VFDILSGDGLAAVVLGIIQGLTEFLPVSSSAHLILVPWLFGWEPQGLFFDVSLHAGTAIAVLAFFWREWIALARETVKGILEGKPFANEHRRLAWYLVVATVPAVIAGLTLEETVEKSLRSPLVTVFTLIGIGALLFVADRQGNRDRSLGDLAWMDSILIGISQAVALIPGVSRSGITISTALLRNVDRTGATRFSFLLSTPVIVGAALLEGWRFIETVKAPAAARNAMESIQHPWIVLALGVSTAAVTGFFCIRYFLRYVQTNSFLPFVIYRLVLAGVILLFYFQG